MIGKMEAHHVRLSQRLPFLPKNKLFNLCLGNSADTP